MFERLSQTSREAAIFYHLPGDERQYALLCTWSDQKTDENQSHFLFHPFQENTSCKTLYFNILNLFSADKNEAFQFPELNEAELPILPETVQSSDQQHFLNYVERIQQQLQNQRNHKIVAARKKRIKRQVQPLAAYNELVKRQPNAFVSLVYIPSIMCWVGASPEVLLEQLPSTEWQTYSLAGSRTAKTDIQIPWGEKEIEEQKIVSQYLWEEIDPLPVSNLRVQGPETIQAGYLQHLRTLLRFRPQAFLSFESLAEQLHPSPAVCGYPKQSSLQTILQDEKLDRQYYSGYLGPMGIDGHRRLFVNLRCAQLFKEDALVYAGAGITCLSQQQAEWEETEWKMQLMESILQGENSKNSLLTS